MQTFLLRQAAKLSVVHIFLNFLYMKEDAQVLLLLKDKLISFFLCVSVKYGQYFFLLVISASIINNSKELVL